MLTFILFGFLQFLQNSYVLSDCGFPGKPADIILNVEKSRYDEDEQIEVKCKDSRDSKLLVFHWNGTVSYSQPGGFYDFYHTISMRQKCRNGTWIGGQPRCAHSVTKDVDMERISIYDDSKQQKLIDLDRVRNRTEVQISEILERVTIATFCQTCSDDKVQTCMTSTSKNNQKWRFWFETKFNIPLIVLTIRNDPKLDVNKIVVRIKEDENSPEIRTCKVFNIKREFVMRPRFINFVEKFSVNFTYSSSSYPDINPMIELTFICSVKWDILQEEKDPGHGVSWRAKSIAKYMEVHFNSQSGFDRPITLCSWEFMQFPQDCGQPDIPLNSKIVQLWDNFRVDYKCAENYTLIKNNNGHIGWLDPEKLFNQYSRRCGADGDWFDESASCKPDIFCSIPHNINHLTTSYENQTYFNSTLVAIPGTIETLSCVPDYAGEGSWNRVCSENGSWIGKDAFCSEEQPNSASPQRIIIISLIAVLIIGGLLVGVAFFVVIRRLRRPQETDLSDAHYNDNIYENDNEDYNARYYEAVNYEALRDEHLDKQYERVSYLPIAASNSLKDVNVNYNDVTHNDNDKYLKII